MTKTSEAIVTALDGGPSTARDLSQNLQGISYANVRQTLGRLVKAGFVTKLGRGVYALADCDTGDCDKHVEPVVTPETAAPVVTHPPCLDDCDIRSAVAATWADFEAMNDPHDPRAWA